MHYLTNHFEAELARSTPDPLPTAPWNISSNLDPYTITTRGDPTTTLEQLLSRDSFTTAISRLPVGKAPGPDGVPAEIIKHLHPSTLDAIFDLFLLFAKHSFTPQ
jgi:hypothetical protein